MRVCVPVSVLVRVYILSVCVCVDTLRESTRSSTSSSLLVWTSRWFRWSRTWSAAHLLLSGVTHTSLSSRDLLSAGGKREEDTWAS